MKKIILDTNFILNCVKGKIDFVPELEYMGYKILIPIEVLAELRKIVNSKQKLHDRQLAEIAIEILKKRKFEEIKLPLKDVDRGITRYALKNNCAIATLDRMLKYKLGAEIITIRNKKKLAKV